MVYGGRSSPLNPIRGLYKLTLDPSGPSGPCDSEDQDTVKLCVEEMVCTGDPPPARWRHTATVVSHKGEIKHEVEGDLLLSLSLCSSHFLKKKKKIIIYHIMKPSHFSFRQRLSICVWWEEPSRGRSG